MFNHPTKTREKRSDPDLGKKPDPANKTYPSKFEYRSATQVYSKVVDPNYFTPTRNRFFRLRDPDLKILQIKKSGSVTLIFLNIQLVLLFLSDAEMNLLESTFCIIFNTQNFQESRSNIQYPISISNIYIVH